MSDRRTITWLGDWYSDDAPKKKREFVKRLVAAELPDTDLTVTTDEIAAAWRRAQSNWELAVSEFRRVVVNQDLDEAERLARRQLGREAEIRLRRRGYKL